MSKTIGILMMLLSIGCFVETDSQPRDLLAENEEENQETPSSPPQFLPPSKENGSSGDCSDAYQIFVFKDEITNRDIVMLIPIPCDPRPFIDLGRPAPISL